MDHSELNRIPSKLEIEPPKAEVIVYVFNPPGRSY